MDVTSAINSLGNDYVAKVTDAMKQSAAVNLYTPFCPTPN